MGRIVRKNLFVKSQRVAVLSTPGWPATCKFPVLLLGECKIAKYQTHRFSWD
jgi:hypothetical protein